MPLLDLFERSKKNNRRPVFHSTRTQLPMLHLAPSFRNNMIATVGEFVGTFFFLFFSYAGTQVSMTPKPPPHSPPNTSNLLYSALSFGFSLTINVWAFYRITGGLFNPSVTLALCLVGGMPILRGLLVFAAQIVGGIAAAGVVSALFPGPLNVETRLGGGASISQGMFIEMFLTAQLVFVVIMLAVVKQKSTFLAPVAIGLAFFVAEMIGDYYTGGSLNPARSLGPDVINRSFPGYHWIYWVGPGLGSLLACGFYTFLRLFQYETVNPGQDYDEWEAEVKSRGGSFDDAHLRGSRTFSESTFGGPNHSPTSGPNHYSPPSGPNHYSPTSGQNHHSSPLGQNNHPPTSGPTGGAPTNGPPTSAAPHNGVPHGPEQV